MSCFHFRSSRKTAINKSPLHNISFSGIVVLLYPSKTSWIFCEVSTIFFLVSSLLENASVIFTTENFSQQCFSDLMISFKMTYAHPNLSCTLSQGDICWRYLKNYFWSLCTKLVIHSCQINNSEVLSLTPLIAAPMQMFTYTQGCLFTDFRRNLNH